MRRFIFVHCDALLPDCSLYCSLDAAGLCTAADCKDLCNGRTNEIWGGGTDCQSMYPYNPSSIDPYWYGSFCYVNSLAAVSCNSVQPGASGPWSFDPCTAQGYCGPNSHKNGQRDCTCPPEFSKITTPDQVGCHRESAVRGAGIGLCTVHSNLLQGPD